MKKFIALFLVILTLLSLIACSSSPESQLDNLNTPNNILSEDSSSPSEDNKTKVDMSKVTESTPFSEGKAWVRIGDITSQDDKTIHCINKKGEILFSLNNVYLNGVSTFHNGIALVYQDSSVCICDENGKVTTPSQLGADEFLASPSLLSSERASEYFKGGYVLAKKTETTFNGSSTKLAIFNSKLEKLSDFSEELFEIYQDIGGTYYNGYVVSLEKDKIFDLRTGRFVDDPASVLASFNPQYASDLWSHVKDYRGNYYYETFSESDTKTIDLAQYSETLYRMYDFQGGVAPIVFRSSNKYFFTLIKEDGSFCYEPIELSGNFENLYICKGKYVIRSITHLETFDKTGKIAELELPQNVMIGASHIRFSDDIINIEYASTSYKGQKHFYYTYDFKPLF
ncbi:MAG: hypothetical protein J6A83_01930 [Clostridia bacterium]|nr:hypothetical protein [Clostridia bacterium]